MRLLHASTPLCFFFVCACGGNDLRHLGLEPHRPVPPIHLDTGDTGWPDIAEPPVVNEFLAYSVEGPAAGDGDPVDWIELYNPTDADMGLGGFVLSNDPGDRAGNPLDPDLVVPARGYLVLYADGRPELGPTHLPFVLGIDGDIALFYRFVAVQLIDYEAQLADESAARQPDGSLTWGTDPTPTPGAAND